MYLQSQLLVAFPRPRTLCLQNCLVNNNNQGYAAFAVMADSAVQVPAGMTALTQLTWLVVTLGGDVVEEVDFSWLGLLHNTGAFTLQ